MVDTLDIEQLEQVVTDHIRSRTFRRISNLRVKVEEDRVVVWGRTPGYYVKQLVIHAIFEVLQKLKISQGVDIRIEVESNRLAPAYAG